MDNEHKSSARSGRNPNDLENRNHTPETDYEILRRLKDTPRLYAAYQKLNSEWKQKFLDFCQGKVSLPLTYDPFFKSIFHPDIHPDRLSRFVSSLLGIFVRVVKVLPSEDSVLNGKSVLIMDLLAELEDGSLVNVEIQKQEYGFPAERISCYSSDLVMRQYTRVKGERGKNFTYRDIKKVYVIVIFEKGSGIFHKIPDAYIHHGKVSFDTGLNMELLQEYCLVALDVFRKFPYTKDKNEQTGWLSLLVTENLTDAEKYMNDYPWLEEIYREIAMLRHKPEEVLGMFSEALRILEHNTMVYLVEQQQKELEEKDAVISEKDAALNEKDALINKLKAELDALREQQEELSKSNNK